MDPGIKQALRNIGPDSGADLLDHHRHLQRTDKGLDGVQNTTPVRLALGLDRLLKRVQMDEDGIGADIRHGAACQIDTARRGELHTAKIADQRHRWRALPQRRLGTA